VIQYFDPENRLYDKFAIDKLHYLYSELEDVFENNMINSSFALLKYFLEISKKLNPFD
jgi:polyphosphate kinase 2 (PPK2 family)